jgi:hypothetical protein
VLRARTLDTLLTVRVQRGGFQTTPAFFPDGTRLVLVGAGLSVIDRGLGTLLESIDVEPSAGQFTPDGRRFISLDSANRRLLEFEVSPLPDAAALREVVTHWSGDGTTSDIVGGTHGLTADGVRFEPGRYGLAFAFDGASRGVSFGRRLNLEIALDDGGYAAWVKPRRTGVPLHIASRTGPAGWNWTITSEGRLAFCLVSEQGSLSCDTGGLVGETTLRPDRWYHVAVVRSGSVLTLFVDARQDGARSIPDGFQPPAPSWNEAVLRLGAGPEGSAPFHGLIDEVLLFRRALSGEDLARVMRATWLDAR